MSDGTGASLVALDHEDAEAIWEAWAGPRADDILARAAFDRALRVATGLEDLDREIIIAAAGLVASMDIRPVRLGRHERRLAERLHDAGLAEVPLTAGRARRALPKGSRRKVDRDQVAEALDRLVAAGLADRHGEDEWVLRAQGSEAWVRLSLRGTEN